MFKTLRSRIALLLIAANLPVIAFAIAIGKQQFATADVSDRDRLVQAAALVAARAAGSARDGAPLSDADRNSIFRDRGSRADIAAAIVKPSGEVIARDEEAAPFGAAWLPSDGLPVMRLPDDARILKARGSDGRAYRYATAPIKGSDARAIVGSRYDVIGRSLTHWLFLTLGLPALMILLCVGLVLYGIERFVLRWIRALRAIAAAYDGGRMEETAERLDGAPRELAELGETLTAMSQRVNDRSTALNAAVGERDRLLRELHHRVKNNFQMIASLLALQRQEAPETLSAVLRAPENRVRAMAAAYKVSYASGEIGHVAVAELIRDVASQARQAGDGRRFDVRTQFPEESFEIDLDLAVSLGLLLTELLSAASGGCETAAVAARSRPGGKLALTVSGPSAGWLPSSGLSQRLIQAYAIQLSTSLTEIEGGTVELVVALASDKPAIGMRQRAETS